jgi:hypothetical protein
MIVWYTLKHPNKVLKREAPPRMNRAKKKYKVINMQGHVKGTTKNLSPT